MALETPGIDKYDKMEFLVDRWLTQIHLVAPEGLSTVAEARRGRPISIWWGRGAQWGALGRIGVVKKDEFDPPFCGKTVLKHRRNIGIHPDFCSWHRMVPLDT